MKKHTKVPDYLLTPNPHQTATGAYWDWERDNIHEKYQRMVVLVSIRPPRSPMGWVMQEAALRGSAQQLGGESYWFYLDEVPFDGATPQSSTDTEALRRAQEQIAAQRATLDLVLERARQIVDVARRNEG